MSVVDQSLDALWSCQSGAQLSAQPDWAIFESFWQYTLLQK